MESEFGDDTTSDYGIISESKHPLGTTFRAEEAPPGYRMGEKIELYESLFERFYGYNEGDKNGWWRDQRVVTSQQKYYILEAVASQLELNDWQKDRATELITRVEGQRYSNVGGLNMVAFCLCHITVEDDEWSQRYYYPTAAPDKNDRLFSKMFDYFGFDPQKTANTIQKLRYETGRSHSNLT